jgi:O-antigen/teichoic acid export membrane protein
VIDGSPEVQLASSGPPVGVKDVSAAGAGAPDLGRKVRGGVVWTTATRVSVQLLQLGTSIVLARLLAPEAFGVVALSATVIGFTALFVDLGLSSAIVQRPVLDDRLLSTAFWLNALLGLVLAAPIALLAPLAADFFDEPELSTLLPVASLSFVLSLNVVQLGLLRRELDFRRIGYMSIVNSLVTAAVSITGALLGLGAMALILGSVAATVVGTVQSYLYVPWRPTNRPDRTSALDLWRYSRGLLGFGIVNYWSRNADNLLIGRFLGTTALGFYGRAYNLMLMPVTQMSSVLSTVLFPTLTKVQHDRERFARAWLMSTKASWVAGAPLGIGMAVTAPALVETLYGTRWLPMAPILGLLAASVPAQLIGSNTGAVFQARARNGLQFRLGLVTSAATIIAIVVALPFGVEAVAGALLVKSWVTLWVPLVPALRLAGVPIVRLLRALAYTGAAVAVMALAVWSTGRAMTSPAPVVLLAQVAVGAVVYLPLFWLGERRFVRELRGVRR